MTEEKIVEETPNVEQQRTEEFEMSGADVVAKIKYLIREGNIRRLSLQTEAGKTLVEIPLTVGIVGGAAVALVAPMLAAVAAIGAVVTKLKLKVERVEAM